MAAVGTIFRGVRWCGLFFQFKVVARNCPNHGKLTYKISVPYEGVLKEGSAKTSRNSYSISVYKIDRVVLRPGYASIEVKLEGLPSLKFNAFVSSNF